MGRPWNVADKRMWTFHRTEGAAVVLFSARTIADVRVYRQPEKAIAAARQWFDYNRIANRAVVMTADELIAFDDERTAKRAASSEPPPRVCDESVRPPEAAPTPTP